MIKKQMICLSYVFLFLFLPSNVSASLEKKLLNLKKYLEELENKLTIKSDVSDWNRADPLIQEAHKLLKEINKTTNFPNKTETINKKDASIREALYALEQKKGDKTTHEKTITSFLNSFDKEYANYKLLSKQLLEILKNISKKKKNDKTFNPYLLEELIREVILSKKSISDFDYTLFHNTPPTELSPEFHLKNFVYFEYDGITLNYYDHLTTVLDNNNLDGNYIKKLKKMVRELKNKRKKTTLKAFFGHGWKKYEGTQPYVLKRSLITQLEDLMKIIHISYGKLISNLENKKLLKLNNITMPALKLANQTTEQINEEITSTKNKIKNFSREKINSLKGLLSQEYSFLRDKLTNIKLLYNSLKKVKEYSERLKELESKNPQIAKFNEEYSKFYESFKINYKNLKNNIEDLINLMKKIMQGKEL